MDREKQIEEMSDYIDNYIEQVNINHWYSNELDDGLAETLYNAGYRKIVKTDWLTKGISEEQIKREKDESLKEFFEGNCKKYGYRKQIEVAREIFKSLEAISGRKDGLIVYADEYIELKKKYTEESRNDR